MVHPCRSKIYFKKKWKGLFLLATPPHIFIVVIAKKKKYWVDMTVSAAVRGEIFICILPWEFPSLLFQQTDQSCIFLRVAYEC